MKCLIYAREDKAKWVKNYFNGIMPYMLKVVNKPFIEYYVDLCSILRIHEVRIVTDLYLQPIQDYFEQGTKWGVSISYQLTKPEDSLKKVILKNSSFCKDDDLLIIDGFMFFHYHKDQVSQAVLPTPGTAWKTDSGTMLYFRQGMTLDEITQMDHLQAGFPRIESLSSIQDFFRLSIAILSGRSTNYALPGYSNADDAIYGTNFVYSKSVKLTKPYIAGNFVRIKDMASIGPNVIIGNNVIVDSLTTIENSIIYDNSYIGSDLEIKDKIIYKNHLISGLNGESILMTDDFLLSGMEQKVILSFFEKLLLLIVVVLIMLIQTIPYMLLRPIIMWWTHQKGRKVRYFIDKKYSVALYDEFKPQEKNILANIYYRLSLDKYRLLWEALQGKLLVVGNRLLEESVTSRKAIKELTFYQPGVFYYAESEGQAKNDNENIHEAYYFGQRNIMLDLRIIFKTLILRITH